MLLYEFKNDQGDVIELPFDPAVVPSIGEQVEHPPGSGNRYTRIFSGAQIDAGAAAIVHQYPYESVSLEPGWPGCKTGPRGGQVVRSRQHEREIMAASKDVPGGQYARV